MSGYAVVDVAIGLSFVFLVLSVFATSIVEAVSGLLSYRAKSLEDWLAANLTPHAEPRPAGLPARVEHHARNTARAVARAVRPRSPTAEQRKARHILGHPVVYAMTKGSSRPSYVPRERFVSALLGRGGETRARLSDALTSDDPAARTKKVIDDIRDPELRKQMEGLWSASGRTQEKLENFRSLAQGWFAEAPAADERIGALIGDLPNGPIKRAMQSLWVEAHHDARAFRADAEAWFDEAMQRLSGWYKRRTQVWLWGLGLTFALLFDVDAIRIADHLWRDQTLRQLLVDQAAKSTPASGVDPGAAADQLSSLGLPLGWNGWPSGFTNWISTLLGLVLTSAAVSLGAPFWFDTLSKLANLRNAGPKPRSSEPTTPGSGGTSA
jgi:hypothetical protein